MEITELPTEGYEKVVRARDPESGLHALIAVHDTTCGPALGGMRMWDYGSEDEALTDVLRLSKGMTYKSAVAHTGLGGGKSVILGPTSIKSEALYLAMGRFVDSLGGLYITAEDVNTRIADLEIVKRATRYVTGLSRESGSSGNPSPYTARGCYLGIRACLERVFGDGRIDSRSFAVQGVGSVGSALARELAAAGGRVTVYDTKREKEQRLVDETGCETATAEEIHRLDVDVFCPCALGGTLNDETIPELACRVVAGSANNQLLEARHGEALRDRGILYAPDYVINAGGIINVAVELLPGGYEEDVSLEKIRRIPDALHEIFTLADERGICTARAADLLAEHILAKARKEKERV